ncbi:MAG: hypothetical protein V7L26_11505 [Nostoc sp.]|uniref:hypothetical protein n=1 Tax=Nostoc sp. TaxID=1180 RepID=UPI002FF15C45
MSQKQLEIDPQIDWLPINLSAQELGLHPSQIRRDRGVLAELGLIRYTRKGLYREAFECIKLFRKLVDERGRDEAIHVIGDKWNERQG